MVNGSSSLMTIVSGASLSWPWSLESNCARIIVPSQTTLNRDIGFWDFDGEDDEDFYISIPIVALDMLSGDDSSSHFSSLNIGDIQAVPWTIQNSNPSDYNATLLVENVNTGTDGRDLGWVHANIDTLVWMEFQRHYELLPEIDVSEDYPNGMAVRCWPRDYDENGNLVADASNYLPRPGWGNTLGNNVPLSDFYAAGHYHIFPTVNVSRRLKIGYEGRGDVAQGFSYAYGRTRVALGNWPTPLGLL